MARQPQGSVEEGNYNAVLPGLILPFLPNWKMSPQRTRQIRDSGRVPDVMMESSRGAPVAVECKYDEQPNIANVQKQAETILGRETRKGKTIELAVAALYPKSLSAVWRRSL